MYAFEGTDCGFHIFPHLQTLVESTHVVECFAGRLLSGERNNIPSPRVACIRQPSNPFPGFGVRVRVLILKVVDALAASDADGVQLSPTPKQRQEASASEHQEAGQQQQTTMMIGDHLAPEAEGGASDHQQETEKQTAGIDAHAMEVFFSVSW